MLDGCTFRYCSLYVLLFSGPLFFWRIKCMVRVTLQCLFGKRITNKVSQKLGCISIQMLVHTRIRRMRSRSCLKRKTRVELHSSSSLIFWLLVEIDSYWQLSRNFWKLKFMRKVSKCSLCYYQQCVQDMLAESDVVSGMYANTGSWTCHKKNLIFAQHLKHQQRAMIHLTVR